MASRQNKRLFRRYRHRRATMLAAGAVIVAGCAQTVADWTPPPGANDLQVRWVTHEHAVALAGPNNPLTSQEARRLDRFLNEIDIRPSDRLFVDVGPQSGEVVSDGRIGAINEQLRHYIPGAQATAITGEKGSNRQIRLIVGRYIVVPPNCPDFSRPTAANSANYADSNLGCTTQRNLGLMLADPGDLLRGRKLGPGDAERLSNAYRKSRGGDDQSRNGGK